MSTTYAYGHAKRPSPTKSGPGRYGTSGKPGNRIGKDRPIRAYKALMNAWASKRVTKAPLRDEHGAYTLVGFKALLPDAHGNLTFQRRKWLGGISAQRGF